MSELEMEGEKMQLKHWLYLLLVVIFLSAAVRYISGCGHATQPFTPAAPTILSVSPASGAGGVAITTSITATFDKAMQASSINSSTFTLSSAGGPVSGTVTYDAVSKTASFIPAGNLAYTTTYTASISAAVIDTENRHLELPYSWNFTTTSLAGSLDLSFGTSGVAIFGGNQNQSDRGMAVTADSSDRVMVAAQVADFNGSSALIGYKEDGTLDQTFGSNGVTYLSSFFPEDLVFDQQNNRFLTTGWYSNMLLKAFDQNGAPDTSLNGTGSVSTAGPAGLGAAGYGLRIDSSGRIVVAGTTQIVSSHSALAVWRFQANGQPDTSFNGSGIFVHDMVPGTEMYFVTINGMAIDPAGRIIVSGVVAGADLTFNNVIWCVKPNGSLDTSFGDGTHEGYVQDTEGMMKAVAVDSSGKILVTGLSESGEMQIKRYNSNGSFDPSFGTGGTVIYARPNIGIMTYGAKGRAIATDPSGKIIIAGNIETANLPPFVEEMIIWRCDPNGSLDTTFGNSGWIHIAGSAGAAQNKHDEPSAVIIDNKGRIVITGASNNADGDGDIATWRIN